MAPLQYDFVIVGGGSAGCVLANRLSADPANRVLVLEAGRPDYPWDVFIHMPAALTFPIGSRFYDWKYESEPEPHMGGRRIYHARGKVLGGSSSINGMIFQRGNPLDYERWARRRRAWRPGTTRTACRTSSGWRTAWRPTPTTSSAATTARWCWSAARPRNPLFQAFFEAAQQAGYPLTDDVNGYRQEGFAPFDRNIHRGPPAVGAARATCSPVMQRPQPDGQDPRPRHQDPFEARGRSASSTGAGGRPRSRCDAGEVILCGGAINSPQLLQLSGVGNAGRAERARHRRRARPARRRREPAGPPGGLHPVRLHAAGLDAAVPGKWRHRPWIGAAVALPRSGPGRHQPLRGRRLRPQQRGRRLPEPDVPLPADRGPLRRLVAGRRARLPGARRADVLRRARLGEDHEHGPARAPGAALQLPLHRAGPPRVGRGDPRGPRHPEPAGDGALQRRRDLARPAVRDRRGDPRLGRQGRRDRAAPVVHLQDGHRRRCPSSTPRRCGCTASRACAWWTRR